MNLARLLPALLLAPALGRAAAPAPAAPPAPADCTRCHDEGGWSPARFDHDTTRFPLRDAHAGATCRACHQDVHRLSLDATCRACHQDAHQGRLGTACDRCHDQKSFRSGAGVEAHGETRFPLYGRHALTPCEKCHVSRADRTFAGVPVDCARCHVPDAQRTAGTPVDHAGLGPEPNCRRCHDALGFKPALFPDHARCFPIGPGTEHGRFTCTQCHSSLNGLVSSGACATHTAACTSCHEHACTSGEMTEHHKDVLGYACTDRKCYECHAAGRK